MTSWAYRYKQCAEKHAKTYADAGHTAVVGNATVTF